MTNDQPDKDETGSVFDMERMVREELAAREMEDRRDARQAQHESYREMHTDLEAGTTRYSSPSSGNGYVGYDDDDFEGWGNEGW